MSKKRNGLEIASTWGGIALRVLWWAVRWHPIGTTFVVVSLVAAVGSHISTMFMLWFFLAVGLTLWWFWNPNSMERHLLNRLRSGWRRELVYNAAWDDAQARCKQKDFLALGKVKSNRFGDLVKVKLLAPPAYGWDPILRPLAEAFDARSISLEQKDRDGALLRVRHGDRLAQPIEPFFIPVDELNLMEVPIGLTEDGHPLCLQIQGTHTLIGGCSDSGKSGVIWSILHSLADAVRAGILQIWMCDPKGGVEMAQAEPICSRYSQPDTDRGTADAEAYEPMVAFLEQAASL
ncbi:MAG TPA: FtsK/SpoIIIE domain-containing protein, partial [Arthrobacter sp.]|nr:FtsK/SpoIIIE domain-containing protein [Arthrobacter sp.]